MTKIINLGKFLNNNSDYCELSHVILECLDKSINNKIVIDLSNCNVYDYVFTEILDHFDKWFPKRIDLINY